MPVWRNWIYAEDLKSSAERHMGSSPIADNSPIFVFALLEVVMELLSYVFLAGFIVFCIVANCFKK